MGIVRTSCVARHVNIGISLHYMLLRSISFLLISIAVVSFGFGQLSYGSRVTAIHTVDCERKDIVLPSSGLVSVLCFFDISSPGHINVLNNINFILANLKQGDMARVFAISKGPEGVFKELKQKYNLIFGLINDQNSVLMKLFNADCGTCIKIVVIDKKCSIRYLSSNFDPDFLREVIQRYINEGVIHE